MSERPPEDYAEILRKHFATMQTNEKPRWKMSKRNKERLQKIRARVEQLRG